MGFLSFLLLAAITYLIWRITDQLPDLIFRISEIQRDVGRLGSPPEIREHDGLMAHVELVERARLPRRQPQQLVIARVPEVPHTYPLVWEREV